MSFDENKEKLSVKLDERKVKLEEKKEQGSRIKQGDCSPCLSLEPYE